MGVLFWIKLRRRRAEGKGDCYFTEGGWDRYFSHGNVLAGTGGNEGHAKWPCAGGCSRQRNSKWEHV